MSAETGSRLWQGKSATTFKNLIQASAVETSYFPLTDPCTNENAAELQKQ